MTKFKRMTPASFNKVKLLQEAGLKTSIVSQIVGISHTTVWRMYKCESWQEYVDETTKVNNRIKTKDSTPITPTFVATAETDAAKILANVHEKLTTLESKLDTLIGKVEWIENNIEVRKRKFF